MSDIWNENTGVQVNPNEARSFAGSGQIYNADLFGGFNITAEKANPLFTFRRGDGSIDHSEMLTNLDEAGKIGSTMAFLVTHIGVRIVSLDSSTAITPAIAEALKFLLGSAQIEVAYGSNKTKVGEFAGLHFLAPVDYVAADATNTAAAANAGASGSSFIKLSQPIQIQKNLNISGTVRFGAAVPSILLPASPSDPALFGFVVDLYGVKKVDA